MRLPSGVVTFCFTDIEGSTRLARRHPAEWPIVLDRHHAVLRTVWQRCGGVEVKTEGDAFFVAFADPVDAVRAAAEAQQALADVRWPIAEGVRVRIGLHTGEASAIEDDYVGAEVHLAARVAAAAHGRQVLVSGRTAELVGDALPNGLTVTALGSFALKDFEDGVELLAVRYPGQDAELPAPRALPLAAHNLPLLRSSFVGRDVERIEVAKLVSDHPLVTVIGPGGAGKTRLASEVGRMLASEVPDGVWVVLLAGLPAGADIAATVARTLGIADVPGTDLTDALSAALAERQQVLVLDNCEHVLASAARLVDHLLRQAPGLHVLATSRQALAVRGERVWSLPALVVPSPGAVTREAVLDTDAGELFADRAAAANPNFVLTDATAPAVAAICRSVDGLPLALELAAATTRMIPLDTLAVRIADSARVLRSGNRHDDPRQQTVDELIRWSYDLLDELQQAVFRRLAVFRGGCTVEAAEAVLPGGAVGRDDVLPTLADLVDRSLLVLDDDRYRMLVLVRGFAEQRLAEHEELELIRDAHATWARADGGIRPGLDPVALRRAEPDLDNYHAAFRQLVGKGAGEEAFGLLFGLLGNFLLHRGHYDQFDELLAALESTLEDDPARHAQVLANRAQLALLQDRHEAGSALVEEAASIARRHDLPEVLAGALALRGGDRRMRGDLTGALADFDEALQLQVSALRRATLIEGRGLVLGAAGDDAGALAASLEAADIYEAEQEMLRAVAARLDAAERLAATDAGAAVSAVEQALIVAADASVPRIGAHAHYVRARLARVGHLPGRKVGDRRALADLDEAVTLAGLLSEPWVMTSFRVERAVARAAAGDVAGARADLTDALSGVLADRVQPAVGNGLAVAALLLAADDPERAAVLAASALAISTVERPDDDLVEAAQRVALARDVLPVSRDAALALALEGLGAPSRREG